MHTTPRTESPGITRALRALLSICTLAFGCAPGASSDEPPTARSDSPTPRRDEPDPRPARHIPVHEPPSTPEPSDATPAKPINPDFDVHRTERTDAFELRWSLRAEKEGDLRLRYEIDAKEELYVSDRLWVDAPKAESEGESGRSGDPLRLLEGAKRSAPRRIPDPFGVYRFVAGDTLRLVFDQAPSPPHVHVHRIFAPLYSRIAAGETHHGEVSIALPVQEYSALARNVADATLPGTATRVELVFAYRLRSKMDASPEPPLHEDASEVGYIVHDATPFVSAIDGVAVPVARRKGLIARYELPGE